jgi:citrate lyase beta subunit
MPTLETKVVFDQPSFFQLRDYILDSNMMSRIITFRIESLDLLNILNLRCDINRTIYDSTLGHTIDQLITVFMPAELELSAPGFEGLCHDETLSAELSLDICRGLFAKTAIHPSQVDIIHAAYRVGPEELEAASAIVDPYNPAVFLLGDRMCEKAVHTNWALTVLERAKLFGTCQLVKEAS